MYRSKLEKPDGSTALRCTNGSCTNNCAVICSTGCGNGCETSCGNACSNSCENYWAYTCRTGIGFSAVV